MDQHRQVSGRPVDGGDDRGWHERRLLSCTIGILSRRQRAAGIWIATGAGFGIVDGGTVERELFERLHAATDPGGKTLLSNGGKRIDRVLGYDMTFSAPKSVSVLWALCDEELRGRIEAVQAEAVKAAVRVLEKMPPSAGAAATGCRAKPSI